MFFNRGKSRIVPTLHKAGETLSFKEKPCRNLDAFCPNYIPLKNINWQNVGEVRPHSILVIVDLFFFLPIFSTEIVLK